MYLKVKSDLITSSTITLSPNSEIAKSEIETFDAALKGRSIQSIPDFGAILTAANKGPSIEVHGISKWLNEMFGKTV